MAGATLRRRIKPAQMAPALGGAYTAAWRLLWALGLALVLASCSPSDNTGTLHTSKGDFTFRLELAAIDRDAAHFGG